MTTTPPVLSPEELAARSAAVRQIEAAQAAWERDRAIGNPGPVVAPVAALLRLLPGAPPALPEYRPLSEAAIAEVQRCHEVWPGSSGVRLYLCSTGRPCPADLEAGVGAGEGLRLPVEGL